MVAKWKKKNKNIPLHQKQHQCLHLGTNAEMHLGIHLSTHAGKETSSYLKRETSFVSNVYNNNVIIYKVK